MGLEGGRFDFALLDAVQLPAESGEIFFRFYPCLELEGKGGKMLPSEDVSLLGMVERPKHATLVFIEGLDLIKGLAQCREGFFRFAAAYGFQEPLKP